MATQTTARPNTRNRKPEPARQETASGEHIRPQSDFPRIDGAISGTLGGDPELRFTSGGRPVANLSVASTERFKNEDTGRWEDGETTWHRVNVWGTQAENVAETLQKGDRVVAVGYFQDREWEDSDGNIRVSTEFTATEIGACLLFRSAVIKRTARSHGK